MKITVRKIAEEAGVSPASVSRYINGSEDVSSEIASKVESALFSLGGSPVVRRPRKQIILILLTHLRFDFYGRTLAELLEQEPQSEYILQYLQSCGLRTVMCGGVALDHQSDRVHVNDIAAAYEGTNYLLDLGHREILFLSDDEQKIGAGFQRITGSRKAMEERGLEFPESLVLRGGVTFEAGYQAMATALREKKQFTAAFAFSDELAVGVMAALYDAGLRVPEDISVLGYDDLTIATRIRPALTTIHQPIDVFIEKSLELFRQPPKSIHSEILLPHSIVERQSCRRLSDPVPKSV